MRTRGDGLPHAAGPARIAGPRDMAAVRDACYRLLAVLLMTPEAPRLRTAAALAGALARRDDALAAFPFYPHWRRLRAALAGAATDAALEAAYARLFLVRPQAPPRETAYCTRAPQWVLADLSEEYADAGAALAPGTGEPPDAAAVELEFMAYLCGREHRAWARGLTKAAVVLAREYRFLTRHLARWMPAFADRVAHVAPGTFHAQVADAARAFVLCDRDLVALACRSARLWA